MTVLIVEDNEIQLKTLQILIHKFNPEYKILATSSYVDSYQIFMDNSIQLFLLDVELDISDETRNGIELAKYIRSLEKYMFTPIIFITSIPEKIQIALHETHCFDYILKPYSEESLYKSLKLVTKSPNILENNFSFCDIHGIHIRIKENTILYCESNGHLVHIHTASSEYTTSDRSLDSFKEKLDSYFFRCHKKFIINMNFATQYDKTNRYVMIEKHSIPVGRAYKQSFEERYQNL